MHMNFQLAETARLSAISTGHLPPAEQVQALVDEAHRLIKPNDEGRNADYIPALADGGVNPITQEQYLSQRLGLNLFASKPAV